MAEKVTYVYDKNDKLVLKINYEEDFDGTFCGCNQGCPLAIAYPDSENEFCGLDESEAYLDTGEQFWTDSYSPAWCSKNRIISCEVIKFPEDEKMKFNLAEIKEGICKHYCILEKNSLECNPREMCKYSTCILSELIKGREKREDN